MIIAISSWYNEPNVNFNISFKVHNLIWKYLTNDIMKPFGLEDKDPDFLLRFVTATASDIFELEVRGPEIKKRSKSISYGLWLPYEKITNAENYLETYLHYYFNALALVFRNYGINGESIREVQIKVESEVLDNDTYSYESSSS